MSEQFKQKQVHKIFSFGPLRSLTVPLLSAFSSISCFQVSLKEGKKDNFVRWCIFFTICDLSVLISLRLGSSCVFNFASLVASTSRVFGSRPLRVCKDTPAFYLVFG